jgi:transcriptional regulator with XRE-family HTH domain
VVGWGQGKDEEVRLSGHEGPALRRRRLGAELKRCRGAAGLTQEQVSRRFEWHAAKVTRIESGQVTVTPRDVKDLLDLYDVRDPRYRETLVELARATRRRAWWAEYSDILRPDSFIVLEAEASTTRNWEPTVVPGLLQTEAYMRALFASSLMSYPRDQIDRRVALRLARQRRLTDDDPLTLRAILDESVTHRLVGGERVMAGQRRHLAAMAELPNITVRILPHHVGEHPLLGRSVAILEFREAAYLDAVYVEGFGRARSWRRDPAEVARYRTEFDQLDAKCVGP